MLCKTWIQTEHKAFLTLNAVNKTGYFVFQLINFIVFMINTLMNVLNTEWEETTASQPFQNQVFGCLLCCWYKNAGSDNSGWPFLSFHTRVHSVSLFLSRHCKVTNLLALAIGGGMTQVTDRGQRAEASPPLPPPWSPFFSLPPPLLTPSEVLLFSPSAPCAGGTSLWQN